MSDSSLPKDTFRGYAVSEPNGTPTLQPFQPPASTPYTLDIKVQYCGLCGSDLHTLRAGWGPVDFPVVVGHEIIGTVTSIGSAVSEFLPGDIVGVGSLASSCGACKACTGACHERDVDPSRSDLGEHGFGGVGGLPGGNEQYCRRVGELYNWTLPNGKSYGGMADMVRVHENFVFKLPVGIDLVSAGPLLCAGITMYSPLRRAGLAPGARVGIIGLGGLGHYGVMFAKAMGYTVSVLSHSRSKAADAEKLGAEQFIYTGEPEWEIPHARSLDLLICTNFAADMPMGTYLKTLDIGGTFVVCGIPEGKLPQLSWVDLAQANLAVRGSNVGSKKEIYEMLELVAEKGLEGWVEVGEMKDLGKYVEKMEKGEARYRYVLKADFD